MKTLEDLIDDFDLFEDWEERYRYLIDLGQALPQLEEGKKTDEHIVRGCTSRVWMIPKFTQVDGTDCLVFEADSDAQIVRGLIYILMAAYNEKPRAIIASVKIDEAFDSLGLNKHLSPNRRNGFFSMVSKIQSLASVDASASTC